MCWTLDQLLAIVVLYTLFPPNNLPPPTNITIFKVRIWSQGIRIKNPT